MVPPMSQILKAVARNCRQSSANNASNFQREGHAIDTTKTTYKRNPMPNLGTNPPPKKRPLVEAKELELSITIAAENSNIAIDCSKTIENFIENKCISSSCSIERDGVLSIEAPLANGMLHCSIIDNDGLQRYQQLPCTRSTRKKSNGVE